jgi:hypothetical protein
MAFDADFSLAERRLAELLKNVCGRICAVDFGTSWELIDDMEPTWVSHNCKHKLFALDIGSGFCCQLFFGQSPHSTKAREKEKPRFITHRQMSPTVFSHCF